MKPIANDTEIVSITQLKPNPANPRSIQKADFERLKRQITKLGQYRPIIIDRRTGYIIGGHMRHEALKSLGVDRVWVSYIETDSDAEALEYMLSDNDRAGSYDEQMLAELVSNTPEIELTDYKVDLGEPVDLSQLLAKFSPTGDEPPAPDPQTPDVTCPECGHTFPVRS